MIEQVFSGLLDILFWMFIRFKKVQIEEQHGYVIYYKELWGCRQIVEIKPRYF
jgi:hypothetical protein